MGVFIGDILIPGSFHAAGKVTKRLVGVSKPLVGAPAVRSGLTSEMSFFARLRAWIGRIVPGQKRPSFR